PIPDQNATQDALFEFTFDANTFSDPENDTLTYTARESGEASPPGWLTFDANTRTFSGTPLNADVGTVTIEVTADDGTNTVSTTFEIVVANVNDAPFVATPIGDQDTQEK